MKTIQQKRLEFLNETVAHYNSTNRCEANNKCRYNPKSLGLEGKSEGCAIGRHLTKAMATRFDESNNNTVMYLFEQFPKKLQILGKSFLTAMQILHDSGNYWNETGLNEDGIGRYEQIKKEYCTN